MEDLWRRFQDALKNYTDATEDRKIAFEYLKVKDEKSSKEIETQMKKIQKLQVSARAREPDAAAVSAGASVHLSQIVFGLSLGGVKRTDCAPSPGSVSPLTCLPLSTASPRRP